MSKRSFLNNDVVLDAMLESRIWRLRTWFLSLRDLQVMQETNRFQPTAIITEIEKAKCASIPHLSKCGCNEQDQ